MAIEHRIHKKHREMKWGEIRGQSQIRVSPQKLTRLELEQAWGGPFLFVPTLNRVNYVINHPCMISADIDNPGSV